MIKVNLLRDQQLEFGDVALTSYAGLELFGR